MKTMKYLLMGGLLMGFSTAAVAQTGTAADVDAVKQLIQSKPADLGKQMKDFYKANKKNPANIAAFGRAFIDVKDTVNARVAAENLLKVAKEKVDKAAAYELLGDIAVVGSDPGRAGQNYELAILNNPESPEAYKKYAVMYRAVSLPSSIAKLDELHARRPDYPVEALKAHIYYISVQYGLALKTYEGIPASQLERRDWVQYAYSAYTTKNYEKALDVIKRATPIVPNNATLNRLGLYSAAELERAKDAYNYADILFNKVDKDSVTILDRDYVAWGRAFCADSLFDQGIEKFNEAIKLNADKEASASASIHSYLSDAYKGKGEFPKAIQEYETFLRDSKEVKATDFSGMGVLYMGYARVLQGDEQVATLKKADQYFSELIEKYPGQSEEYGTYQRARVNNSLDPTMEQGLAKPYFEKIIELVSAHETLSNTDKQRLESAYRYLLGYYNSVAKDKEQALFYAKKVQELAPSDNINALVESLSKSVEQ